MSVIIKTMNIPKTCEECNLESFCDLWIDARRICGETFTDSKSRIKATIRHPNCPLGEVIHCKDCRWGKEVCGNIECWVDINVPPEYHGYEWFCPNGERRPE